MSKKVLIIDDDSSIISILTYALNDKGYDIIPATDGEEARKLAFEKKPDAIILDVLLPKVDGFTLLKEFRQSKELQSTPIIMISGVYKTYSIIQTAIHEDGASDYFKKPFTLDKLVKRIQDLCPIEVKEVVATPQTKSISKYLFLDTLPDRGEFNVIPVCKLFATLYNQKRSGVLMLTDKSVEKKIMLKDGSPIEVSSNVAGEWLGRLLVQHEILTAEVYKETLELMGTVNKRHGEILLEKGLISPADLYKYLKLQLITKIQNTFNWQEGIYKFTDNDSLDRVSPKKINVYRVVLDG
ncbi:PleD family two-component system response regulator, partial [Thermodesulfobacteriota bacterium]